MKSILRAGCLPALLVLVLTSGLAAQGAGDIITVDIQSGVVLTAPRGGTVTTLVTLPLGLTYGPLTAGLGDASALAIGTFIGGIDRNFVFRVDASGITTLTTYMMVPTYAADVDLDDAGDLLMLGNRSYGRSGLYRAPLSGTSSMNLVALWPKGLAEPLAFTEDIDSGDWWVVDQAGMLHMLTRSGGALLSIAHTGATSLRSSDLVMDPVTGDVLITSGFSLLRYEPARKKMSTVIYLGVPQGGSEAMGLCFDDATRGYLFSYWMGFGPGMFGFVQELDAVGKTVRTTALGSPKNPRNVTAAWGRAFLPLSAPEVGKSYRVALRSRPDARKVYRTALAFSSRPGIPTPLGPVPLNPDALFYLSMSGVPMFRGFNGMLDTTGGSMLAVDIPPAGSLRGIRILMACVVVDTQGFRRILGPHPFTIR